jgi:nifR3 family TIM-barrel protein
MSVNLTPADVPERITSRPIEVIAAETRCDERIGALVEGFDAPFFQAGLAGYSDGPMRLIARRHGCPYCVTEALLDQTLISGGKGRAREDPDLLAESCGTGDLADNRTAGLDDHPIAGQIIGSDPDEMARAAMILVELGYDVIDINLACPVKKIRRRNRGGHLLGAPDEAIAILRAVRDVVPDRLPVTVKLRRAFTEAPTQASNFQRIFDAAYELGCAWTTVHCRTVAQKYVGPSDWSFLADLTRRYPDRLILGSGDIWTAGDIFAMLELTGVAAVAVARGCIGNPWIFQQARQLMAGRPPSPPTLAEQRQVLLDHFDLAVALHGAHAASRLMRKVGIRFAAHHHEPDAVKNEFIGCRNTEQWRAVIRRHYDDDSLTDG